MGQKYEQLTLEERCKISFLHKEGKSKRRFAAIMARSPSTITRELARNLTKTKGYDPSYAQLQTAGRRWRGSKLERQPDLRESVLSRLAMGWSPQQTSNWLAQQGCNAISYESIYRFIYAQIRRTQDYHWRHYLPRGRSYRGWRGRKGGSPTRFIKNRVPISERHSSVSERMSPGHWEVDLMLFSKYGQAMLVAHERYSRLVVMSKLETKQARPLMSQLLDLFSSLPQPLAQTVTFDNGTEFAEHYRLNEVGIKTYFCDVRSPWQKGGVENAIGRLRTPLPRKTDIDNLDNQYINALVRLYNQTPRKCLGYKTPAEVFAEQLLHFKCEFTKPQLLA